MNRTEGDEKQPLLNSPEINKSETEQRSDGGGTFIGSVFTLMSCAVGSGILTLPFGFSQSGLVLAIILLFAMSAITFYSLYLLVVCSDITRKSTYQDVSQIAFGMIGITLVRITLMIALFGSMIGFIVIIGDLLSPVICHFLNHSDCNPFYVNRDFLSLIVVVCIITPLSFFPRIHQFQLSSVFAVLTVLFLAASAIARSCQAIWEGKQASIELFKPSLIGVSQTIPIIAFSLGCHAQVIPIYCDMKPQLKRQSIMTGVTFCSNLGSTILYLLMGIFGYLEFGNNTQGNILMNFPATDILLTFARVGMALHISMVFPLLIWPSRNITDQLLFPRGLQSKSKRILVHTIETLVFIASAYGFAVLLPKITVIFGLTGSVAGMLANYIFPAAFYLKLAKDVSYAKKAPAFLLFFVGVLTGITSTAVQIYQLVEEHKHKR